MHSIMEWLKDRCEDGTIILLIFLVLFFVGMIITYFDGDHETVGDIINRKDE